MNQDMVHGTNEKLPRQTSMQMCCSYEMQLPNDSISESVWDVFRITR